MKKLCLYYLSEHSCCHQRQTAITELSHIYIDWPQQWNVSHIGVLNLDNPFAKDFFTSQWIRWNIMLPSGWHTILATNSCLKIKSTKPQINVFVTTLVAIRHCHLHFIFFLLFSCLIFISIRYIILHLRRIDCFWQLTFTVLIRRNVSESFNLAPKKKTITNKQNATFVP